VYVSTSSDNQSSSAGGADPAPKPSRRAFSPAYKLAMVAAYESAPNGEKGALLRREGLYSSHIIEWTRARDAGLHSAANVTWGHLMLIARSRQ
jgi:transposase